jgi:hypothetical protein
MASLLSRQSSRSARKPWRVEGENRSGIGSIGLKPADIGCTFLLGGVSGPSVILRC